MIKRRFVPGRRCAAVGGGLAAALAMAPPAMAIDVDFGNPDVTARWDNTVRANLGMRMEKQDPRILANPNYDESDGKFKKGDLVTQRLDLLSEFDVDYRKNFGFRVSGAAWYDHAYHDTSVHTSVPGYVSSYDDDHYSTAVSRYVRGPSGEILDAFAWWNFRIADKPADLRIGRLTNYWGEAYLLGNDAISYSQSPVDGVKAVNSPGIELKEVFLPQGQVYLKFQPTPGVALAAQSFFEWKPSRLPSGGTYFAPADFFFEGTDRLPVDALGDSLAHVKSQEGRRFHNWGVSAKFDLEAIESNLGLYYRQFDDYNPWFSPAFTNYVPVGSSFAPTAWRLVYPKNVSLVGASIARAVGAVSVAGEVSYRMHGALNAAELDPTTGQGPRGDTWHALINGTYLLPKTAIWDTGSLVAEMSYSHLGHITSNAAFYKGVGTAACVNPVTGGQGNKSDGCSTNDYAAMAVLFTPQYLQIAPSLDLDVPFTLNYGLLGNGPASGSGNEGTISWSVGAKLTYEQRHEIQLLYADTYSRAKYDPTGTVLVGGNGSPATNDRGWLVLTYKYGF